MKEVEFKDLDDDTMLAGIMWFTPQHIGCLKQGARLTINHKGLWCSVDDKEPFDETMLAVGALAEEDLGDERGCFDFRFESDGVRYGYCTEMVKLAKESGVMAVEHVREDHVHE